MLGSSESMFHYLQSWNQNCFQGPLRVKWHKTLIKLGCAQKFDKSALLECVERLISQPIASHVWQGTDHPLFKPIYCRWWLDLCWGTHDEVQPTFAVPHSSILGDDTLDTGNALAVLHPDVLVHKNPLQSEFYPEQWWDVFLLSRRKHYCVFHPLWNKALLGQ